MSEAVADPDIAAILGRPPETRTLAATVAQRLRARILEGHLRPGTPLRLRALADSLGVSVMPVREALRDLEAERLVVVRPHRGAVVADISVEDAEEIYALRVALEALCAGHAGERLTPADVAELEELFQRMEAAQAASDLPAFIDADHAFHSRLYEVSGRERLTRMIAALQDRSLRYLPQLYAAWRMVENPLEAHRPILAAIRACDAGLIARLTREHMEQAAERLMGAIAREADERAARAPAGRPWRVAEPRRP